MPRGRGSGETKKIREKGKERGRERERERERDTHREREIGRYGEKEILH